jgi:hypothetical protein
LENDSRGRLVEVRCDERRDVEEAQAVPAAFYENHAVIEPQA